MPQNKYAPQQFKNQIANTKGVKSEEVKWTGLNTWLDEKSTKGEFSVTKAEVLKFLKDNEVEVTVKNRTEEEGPVLDGNKHRANYLSVREAIKELDLLGLDSVEQATDVIRQDAMSGADWQKNFDIPDSHASVIRAWLNGFPKSKSERPKFKGWMKGDFEEYQETVFNLPDKPVTPIKPITELPEEYEAFEDATKVKGKSWAVKPRGQKENRAIGSWHITKEDAIREMLGHINGKRDRLLANDRDNEGFKVPQQHRYGDKTDVNQVARVISAKSTLPTGETGKVALEMQGDWEQAGAKHGFREKLSVVQREALKKERAKLVGEFDGLPIKDHHSELGEAIRSRINQIDDTSVKEGQKVPSAPLVQKHYELAFKWLLREGIDEGKDFVGWNAGQVVADRYDLSKEVTHIQWGDDGSGSKFVNINAINGPVSVNIEGEKVSHARNGGIAQELVGKDLSEVIGKDVAAKIVASQEGRLEGEGLKIGGKWALQLYDKMLVKYVKDYVKQWGGKVEYVQANVKTFDKQAWNVVGDSPTDSYRVYNAELGEIAGVYGSKELAQEAADDLNKKESGITKPGIPTYIVRITPEMESSVPQGQSLFSLSDKPQKTEKDLEVSVVDKSMESGAVELTLEEIAKANASSRNLGAVGRKAITPRYVQETVKPNDTVLDFGSGKHAAHTKKLRAEGIDVTAHEFGPNVEEGIHDPQALSRKYDTVFASNVLNVQSGKRMLNSTLRQIKGSALKRAVFNYPESPRYGKMSTEEVAKEIKNVFGVEPVRVGGSNSAPLWEVTMADQPQQKATTASSPREYRGLRMTQEKDFVPKTAEEKEIDESAKNIRYAKERLNSLLKQEETTPFNTQLAESLPNEIDRAGVRVGELEAAHKLLLSPKQKEQKATTASDLSGQQTAFSISSKEDEPPKTGIRVVLDKDDKKVGEVYLKGKLIHQTRWFSNERTARRMAVAFAENLRGKDPSISETILQDIIRENVVPSSGKTTKEIIHQTLRMVKSAQDSASLLGELLEAMETASYLGRTYGEKQLKSDIEQLFQKHRAITKELRETLIAHAKNRLGTKATSHIQAIIDALQEPDYTRLVDNPAAQEREIYNRYKRAAAAWNRIEVEADRNDRLKATKFIRENTGRAIKSVGVSVEVKETLKQFRNTYYKELSTPALMELVDELKRTIEKGQKTEKERLASYDNQVDELINWANTENNAGKTIHLENIPSIAAQPGDELSVWGKLSNSIIAMRNLDARFDSAYMPINYVLAMMSIDKGYGGGLLQKVKGPVDLNFQQYLRNKEEMGAESLDKNKKSELSKKIEELGIKKESRAKIKAYAEAMQHGGIENLRDMGVDEATLALLSSDKAADYLTKEEMEMYKYFRQKLDAQHEPVNEILRRVHNREMGFVPNYFPRIKRSTSFEDTTSALEKIEAARKQPSRRTEQGFSKTRTGGIMDVGLDALQDYIDHMDSVAYFKAYEENLKVLTGFINSPEFADAFGPMGQEVCQNWLSVVANNSAGGAETKSIPSLDKWISMLGRGTTAYRIFSHLKHLSNAGPAMMLIGIDYYAKGTSCAFTPQGKALIKNVAPELLVRGGGDDSFQANKMKSAEYIVARITDQLNSHACFLGAYLKELDRKAAEYRADKAIENGGKVDKFLPTPFDIAEDGSIPVDKDSVAVALITSHASTSSVFFKDMPLMRTKGTLTGNVTVDRALTQYQGYVMERYGYFQREVWQKGTKFADMDKMQAVEGTIGLIIAELIHLGVITVSGLAMKEIAKGLYELLGGTAKAPQHKKDEAQKGVHKLLKEFALGLIRNRLPFVTIPYAMYNYGSTGIPVLDFISSSARDAYYLGKAKKEITQIKAATRVAFDLATAFGVPGSGVVSELTRKALKEAEEPKPLTW